MGQNSDLIAFTSKIQVFYRPEETSGGGGSFNYSPSIANNSAFLHICADLSKKFKSVTAIFLYPSGRPHHALSESTMFYKGLSNSSRDIEE